MKTLSKLIPLVVAIFSVGFLFFFAGIAKADTTESPWYLDTTSQYLHAIFTSPSNLDTDIWGIQLEAAPNGYLGDPVTDTSIATACLSPDVSTNHGHFEAAWRRDTNGSPTVKSWVRTANNGQYYASKCASPDWGPEYDHFELNCNINGSSSGKTTGYTFRLSLQSGNNIPSNYRLNFWSIYRHGDNTRYWVNPTTSLTANATVANDDSGNLFAQWKIPTYTLGVTKTGAGTGTVTDDKGNISCGPSCGSASAAYQNQTPVTLTAVAVKSNGSTFGGWSGDVPTICSTSPYPTTCTVTMSQVRNVTATFNKNAYILTYLPGTCGTISGTTPQTVSYGGSGTYVEAPVNSGYHFVNWSDGNTNAGRRDTNVTTDISVTANCVINTHRVTFDKNNASATGSMSAEIFNEKQTKPLTANGYSLTGYAFAGWATSSTGPLAHLDVGNYTMGTADVTLWAVWTPATCSLVFNKNDAGAIGTMANEAFTYNQTKVLSANLFSKSGYAFAGWATSTNGAVVYADQASYTNTTGATCPTLYAKWNYVNNALSVALDSPPASTIGTASSYITTSGSGGTASIDMTAHAYDSDATETRYMIVSYQKDGDTTWNNSSQFSSTALTLSGTFTVSLPKGDYWFLASAKTSYAGDVNTATWPSGWMATSSRFLRVVDPTPSVSCTIQPDSGTTPFHVKVSYTTTNLNGGAVTINMGEGSPVVQASAPAGTDTVYHTYNTAGSYNVSVTYQGQDPNTISASCLATVKVKDPSSGGGGEVIQ